MPWYNTIAGDPNEFHTDTRVPAVGSPVTAQSVEYSTQDLLDNTANLKTTKAEIAGGNTFTGTQVFTDPAQFPGGIVADQVEFTTPRRITRWIPSYAFRFARRLRPDGATFEIPDSPYVDDQVWTFEVTDDSSLLASHGSLFWNLELQGNYRVDLQDSYYRFTRRSGEPGGDWVVQSFIHGSGPSDHFRGNIENFSFAATNMYDLPLWTDGPEAGPRYIECENILSPRILEPSIATEAGSSNGDVVRFFGLNLAIDVYGGMIRGA